MAINRDEKQRGVPRIAGNSRISIRALSSGRAINPFVAELIRETSLYVSYHFDAAEMRRIRAVAFSP